MIHAPLVAANGTDDRTWIKSVRSQTTSTVSPATVPTFQDDSITLAVSTMWGGWRTDVGHSEAVQTGWMWVPITWRSNGLWAVTVLMGWRNPSASLSTAFYHGVDGSATRRTQVIELEVKNFKGRVHNWTSTDYQADSYTANTLSQPGLRGGIGVHVMTTSYGASVNSLSTATEVKNHIMKLGSFGTFGAYMTAVGPHHRRARGESFGGWTMTCGSGNDWVNNLTVLID